MAVCYNKVMGVAVVVQIQQKKKERKEIGDMERNRRGETVMAGERQREKRNAVTTMVRVEMLMLLDLK